MYTKLNRTSSRILNLYPLDLSTPSRPGICVHALCSQLSTQTTENIVLCLRSVGALLDDPWPREQFAKDRRLCVELLNVLHRSVYSHSLPVTFPFPFLPVPFSSRSLPFPFPSHYLPITFPFPSPSLPIPFPLPSHSLVLNLSS